MQKASLLLTLFLAVLISCEDDDLKAPAEGLVSFYTFNGDSQDEIGTNHGTDTNVTYTVVNKSNKAVEFSGTDSYVTFGDDFDLEQRTISLNIFIRDYIDAPYTIYSSDHAGTQFGKTEIRIGLNNGVDYLYFNVSEQTVGTSAFRQNYWHHVAVVADGKSYRYYLDGKLIASDTFNAYQHADSGPAFAMIGRGAAGKYFNGLMDNLRVYSRALSEKEIKTLAKL